MKIAGKRNDASAEVELFEVFGVLKDHDAKPRRLFSLIQFFCPEPRTCQKLQ
jgi:hypothetical protein